MSNNITPSLSLTRVASRTESNAPELRPYFQSLVLFKFAMKRLTRPSFLLCGFALASKADDACFRNNSELESLTGHEWYNRTLDSKAYRHGWWRTRHPFEPIVGESTLIAGVVYTHSKSTLKMTVLFPPLYPEERRSATLVVSRSSNRRRRFTLPCDIKETTWHCTFRIDKLPTQRRYSFRVIYEPNPSMFPDLEYVYQGQIPAQVSFPKIAAMGCFGPDSTWEKPELQAAVLAERPDLLVLQGDQVYGTDNLAYGFLELVHSIHNLTRRMPTVVQMDDHDYGLPNLFGASNGDEESGSGFGTKPVCVINALQEMAMSHLPDRATNATLDNGIDVRYTNYVYGNVDFAILEARKFKNYKGGTSLLGSDQEDWLREWCDNNESGLKVVLAQTPFASLATNETSYYRGEKIAPAGPLPDSNGNPPEGRSRFMEIARNCTSLVLAGDQHLGIAVTYEDYGVSECTSPAVVNDILYVPTTVLCARMIYLQHQLTSNVHPCSAGESTLRQSASRTWMALATPIFFTMSGTWTRRFGRRPSLERLGAGHPQRPAAPTAS
jgi:PhoD-like phosphatase